LATASAIGLAFALMPTGKPKADLHLLINPGMTEDEVIKVFSSKPDNSLNMSHFPMEDGPHGNPKFWDCEGGVIGVWFDEDGKVISCMRVGFNPKPSLLQWIRNRLRL
jgi:hypothetical protein